MAPIVLREYERQTVGTGVLSDDLVERILREHGKRISIQRSLRGNMWELVNNGWGGYLPLSAEVGLRLEPKVSIDNLFGMLELAHDLKSVHFPPGISRMDTIEQLFDRLAAILVGGIEERGRRGFHRAYVGRSDRLPFVRGSFDLARRLRRPWAVELECAFEEHTADIEDNQILAWTLGRILRSGICSPKTGQRVRRAWRALDATASRRPFTAAACLGRLYHRLNEDYRPLHALCRFFLENSGPSHRDGDHEMPPFLINMPRLFERFVFAWLRHELPEDLEIRWQETVKVGEKERLSFTIDMVLAERSGKALAVLDAKYKAPGQVATPDFNQAFTAAHLYGCKRSFLVYPTQLEYRGLVGDVEVETLCFDLDGYLDTGGRRFLEALLARCGRAVP